MRIAFLVGMEDSYPKAVASLARERGFEVVPLKLAGLRHDEDCDLDLVIDRISHEIGFYRSWLRRAVLAGVPVINDPELISGGDRLLDTALVERLGIRVPRSVLLPQKDYPETITASSLGNLDWPVPFAEYLEWVGSPAELRPVGVTGWRHATKVRGLDDLLAVYDRSGRQCLLLQETVNGGEHYRAMVFGAREVVLAPYDPEFVRYAPEDDVALLPELEERLVQAATAIAGATGYDLCAIEFTVLGDEIIARNFVNPFPDFERAILGGYWFRRVVEATVDLIAARAGRRPLDIPAISPLRKGLAVRLSRLSEPKRPSPETP